MSHTAVIPALLDELLLIALPILAAFALYILDILPLWAALIIAVPPLALLIHTLLKIVKERPRGYSYLGGRGVAVEDLKPSGVVKIRGEYWKAYCLNCEVAAGECVELVEVKEGYAYVKPCR
ncbi:MAG: NfeD family protein [Pyrobaculum sp.]|jgi:membrane protein implicated in regulation of membrane protease activity